MDVLVSEHQQMQDVIVDEEGEFGEKQDEYGIPPRLIQKVEGPFLEKLPCHTEVSFPMQEELCLVGAPFTRT